MKLLSKTPLTEAGGTPVDNASINLKGAAGLTTGHYGASARALPADTYTVSVRIDNAFAQSKVVLEAGKHQTINVIVGKGLAALNTY